MDAEKRFADCCAASALELMIERDEDGQVIARGNLNQPFALVGRDPFCDIHLNDPTVSLRHAFFQVIGGSLFVVDLASATGVHWSSGKHTSGWLTPGEPLRIGPFRIFLTRSAATNPTVLVPDFHPLTSADSTGFPPVKLEFHNSRRDRSVWEVNRVLTLVGRASECKVNLYGDDIALFHAYLVKTIAGLWVVDLLARGGTKVNGKKVRIALLNDGDELMLGKFAIGVSYPKPVVAKSSEDSTVSFDVNVGSEAQNYESSARIGLPDTMLAPNGVLPPEEEAALAPLVPIAEPESVLPMLRQMAELQSIMFAQFQQSMLLMMKMFGHHMGNVPGEMARLTELNGELQKLQGVSEESAGHHEEVWQRMEKLNDERQSLWQRLYGKIAKT